MKISVLELIEQSGAAAVKIQGSDGAMPPGQNGPWNDRPTPVRNTGHWLITFLKAHSLTGKPAFKQAAGRAADYLAGPEARPARGAFLHLQNKGRPPGNGLIGQAWTIESLGIASRQLERMELARLAEEVFLQHDFDPSSGLWTIIGPDGTPGRQMTTLNQHIWFAGAAAELIPTAPRAGEIAARTRGFLDRLHHHVQFGRDGIFEHNFGSGARSGFGRLQLVLKRWRSGRRAFPQRTRAVGYHTFNMYGLALLKRSHHEHPIWSGGLLDPMWKPIDSRSLERLAAGNPFCYLYNPAGIEIAFALEVYRPDQEDRILEYLQRQFSKCFDLDAGLMQAGGASDPQTLAARIYEATRLSDRELSI
jgi:hypothetical protein